MNIFRSLWRWGSLYLLVGLFIAAFFWEENLHITRNDHILLAIGLLLIFGYLMDRWILGHETNFLVSQDHDSHAEPEKSKQQPINKMPMEKIS